MRVSGSRTNVSMLPEKSYGKGDMRQHPNSSSSQPVWMTEHYKLTSNVVYVVCTVLWWGSIVHMHTQARTSKVFKGSFIKPLSKWFQMYVRVSNTSIIYRLNLQVHTAFHVTHQIPLWYALSPSFSNNRGSSNIEKVLAGPFFPPMRMLNRCFTPRKLPASHISHLWKRKHYRVVSSESFQKTGSELETVRQFCFGNGPSSDFPYGNPYKKSHPWSPYPDRPDEHLVKPEFVLGITNLNFHPPIFGAGETSSETTSSARSGLRHGT